MQDLNRSRNTRRNIWWGFAYKFVALVSPFLTRTLLIYVLGAEYLGVSSLCTSVLQVLNLAELGFSSAVVYSMYRPVAEGDVREVAAYLNFFKQIYRWVGATVLAMGSVAIFLVERLVAGDVPWDVNIKVAFAIYLGNTVLSYFLYAYKQSLLNAYQRNDVINKVGMGVLAVQCTAQSLVLLVWPNFYAFAIVMPACTVASNLATEFVVRRILPEYSDPSLCDAQLGTGERAGIRRRVAGLLVQQVCNVTRNSMDNIIISSFIGLTAVACYGNYFTIMSGILGILGSVCAAMTAAVGNSVAVESREKNFRDMRIFVFAYALVSIVLCACLLACYQSFMLLWVGEGLMLPDVIPMLMTLYFYVGTMGDIRSVYVNATGIWWHLRLRALAETVSNVILNVALAKALGIPGIVLATIASLFMFNFLYGSHLTFKHYFGLEFAEAYYTDQLLYLAVAVVVVGGTYSIIRMIPSGGGLPSLLVQMVLACLLSTSSLLIIFGWTRRFGIIVRFVRRVLFSGG